ncbi:MAG: dihydroorotate dehydrogenase (quinone), partial [Campylobacter sp.]|nr:dihydroorotate dehydrogenase (quinone) [Campylobacter sp.]
MYELLRPLLFTLPPEYAHHLAGLGLKLGIKTPLIKNLIKKDFKDEILSQNLLGLNFANPIGIGGGFDKNADLAYGLSYLGFGFLEYGTFTPRPQSGNPSPRLWRIKEHNSLQNAMGFNNEGSAAVQQNIAKHFPLSLPVFANIGKNKTTP